MKSDVDIGSGCLHESYQATGEHFECWPYVMIHWQSAAVRNSVQTATVTIG